MPYDPTARFEVAVSNVEYLRHVGQGLLARIYQPQGPGPFPAVVDAHGGAWSGNDRTHDEPMSLALAASGVVVVALDFQLAPEHPFPRQVQDVNFGVRWVKHHAAELRVDPAWVGGLGASSGGHVMVLNAMQPQHELYRELPLGIGGDPNARQAFVISLWGIVDPLARYRYVQETGQQRLIDASKAFFLTETGMEEHNPQRLLDREAEVELPPLLVIQGDRDTNIPWQIPQKFAESWARAGGLAEFHLFPGAPHGFGNLGGPDADRAIDLMKAFIARSVAGSPPA